MSNVKDFGATGDGLTKDTAAIQKALDAGGTVCFPAGTYLSGTLYMRSNSGIELAPGATILASPDKEDYCARDFCAQNSFSIQEKAGGGHLIVALEVSGITIRGPGKIDGNRGAFFDPEKCSRADFQGWRPSQMLFFCESCDIRITDVELVESPYWTCFLHGCTDVFIRGVKISSHEHAWNADGIDIDCCRHVTVSDCNIQSADDALTVRASGKQRLQHSPGVCEYITVTNCILKSNQAAIRVGVGNGTIRNCAFSNITVRSASFGICILSTYLPREFPNGAEGVEISDILFDNLLMNVLVPVDISSNWIDAPLEKSCKHIHGITIRGIRAHAERTCIIQGNMDHNVYDIDIADSVFEFSGGDCIKGTVNVNRYGSEVYLRPCAFYILNTDSLRFNRVALRWNGESEKWLYSIHSTDNTALEFNDCRIGQPVCGSTFN